MANFYQDNQTVLNQFNKVNTEKLNEAMLMLSYVIEMQEANYGNATLTHLDLIDVVKKIKSLFPELNK